ncbi:cytochrome P450 [Neoconidiobolus thromboides FSU 785]|nr:cytochrome P450 [Neoconidiobolus thromboides FSU 785]
MFTLISVLGSFLVLFLAFYVYKVIHSIFFSPLKNVPGPLINLIFPFVNYIYIINGTYPEYALNLHKKHGNVVRLSWSKISFSSDSALKEIYSTYSYIKDQTYEIFQIIGETILSTRSRAFHRQRKKIIAPSFSEKAIESIEHLVKKNVDIFVNKVDALATQNQKLDLGLYFHYFAFDIIGDLAFGKSFNMLRDGYHPIVKWTHDISKLSILVLLFPFLKYHQFDSIKKLYEFTYESIKEARNSPDRANILNTLIKATDPDTGEHLSEKEIAEESILQIGAGTDTTSNSLTWIFYSLTNNPEVYKKVKEEMLAIFPDKDLITYTKCKSECHYLSAVIHESLRILPVAGSAPTRVVPKGGRVIDGYYIPEKVTVGVTINALHNSPSVWKNPNVFDPQRWLEDGKFKTNSNFSPFLIGPRACVGRTLAWMELYLVCANMIRNFTFKRIDKKKISRKNYVTTKPGEPIEVSIIKN